MTERKTNPSLQKKTAARTAAIQCLYTAAITGEPLAATKMLARLKQRMKNNPEEQKLITGMKLEPNYPMVATLLEGVADRLADIDKKLQGSLAAGWKSERMNPLLIAILQCAIYELCFGKDISPSIVIDEYTRATRSFCDDSEVDFVHGALKRLAQP